MVERLEGGKKSLSPTDPASLLTWGRFTEEIALSRDGDHPIRSRGEKKEVRPGANLGVSADAGGQSRNESSRTP